MPAPKKFWVFDGGVEQYPSVLANDSVHSGQSCTFCHGGDNTKSTRAEAHTGGFNAIPGGPTCQLCHSAIGASAAGGLHTTLNGYVDILADRAFPAEASNHQAATQRYEQQCTKCHTANASNQTACGFCHVSVPDTAGGGLISGHDFNRTPSQDNNCTACHGSRVKDEYYGQNNALLDRNTAAYAVGHPLKDTAYNLVPDVHKTAGMVCTDCHSADEMHGVGAPATLAGDRYDVTTSPACTDCHGLADPTFTAVALHSLDHLAKMDCYVCHAQEYKSCFGCHTDVTDTGVAYFKNNEADPTLAARKAIDPAAAPDALMTFRAGKNPKFGDAGQKEFSVLRHAPIDRDLFSYTNDEIGLSFFGASFNDLPTWKYATPHSIKRNTLITASCNNCHGAAYANFWLTDPVADALGWIAPEYAADEAAANANVTVNAPFAF